MHKNNNKKDRETSREDEGRDNEPTETTLDDTTRTEIEDDEGLLRSLAKVLRSHLQADDGGDDDDDENPNNVSLPPPLMPPTTENCTDPPPQAIDDLVPIPPPSDAFKCCLCLETFTRSNDVHGCNGSNATHYQCTECELEYLRTELASGHAYDSPRWMGGDEESGGGLLSEPGQLPCPLFVAGDCDCAAMPLTGLYGLLSVSDDIAVLYHAAFKRVVEAQLQREGPAEDASSSFAALFTPATQRTTVQQVYRAVRIALDEASMMRCPDCGYPGLKDEACMHIRCEGPGCSTNWCYCCGRCRRRDSPEDCRGCDADKWHLEQIDGWKNFALAGEHDGIGARNEFHRRRMRYYIQRIKKDTPTPLWEEFRRTYPRILTGVPTSGRSISWNELDDASACIPPLFGRSREEDLLWKLPPAVENDNLVDQGANDTDAVPGEREQHQHDPLNLPTIGQALRSSEGQIWAGAFALTLLLLIVRWSFAIESNGFKVVTDILVVSVVYGTLAFGLLRLADYYALHPTSVREVQLFGTEEESPYLAQVGRWGEKRVDYTRFFLGGIAFGSLFVGTSDHVGPLQETCRVIGSIVLTHCLTSFCLLTLVVNASSPPRAEEERQRAVIFHDLLVLLFGLSLCWALGVGLLTCQPEPVQRLGKFLLSLGISGLAAEMAPRVLVWSNERAAIWDRLDPGLRLGSIAFFGCLAVGPTLLSIGNSSGVQVARVVGIIACIGIPFTGFVFTRLMYMNS